jgi:hypothetical protein
VPTAPTTTATTRTATTSAASIDIDARRVLADGGWASPYRRPSSLTYVNAFERLSVSLAWVANQSEQ